MQELFKKYLENRCSPDEVKLLLTEIDKEENRELFKNLVDQQFEAEPDLSAISEDELQNILTNTYQDILSRINAI